MKGLRLAIIPLLTLAMVSCGKKQEAATALKPVPVTVASATRASIAIERVYTGTLEGWKQSRIYASVPEAVVELPVAEGSLVQAGQTVIVLDQAGRASQVRQAKAMYDEAKDNFDKMSRLLKQGAIPEQTVINMKTSLDVAQANYESARQSVELTSPIAGVLTDLSVNVGQTAPLGVPLATIAQTDKLRLTLHVDGRSAAFLKNGQEARIAMTAGGSGGAVFTGKIVEIARSADPETRLFRVELQIDNQGQALSPGAFARATIVVQELEGVLTVPREAVFFTEGIPKVYTITDSSRAEERSISVGENTLERYQILSGLSEGEKVIVLGRSQLESGSLVKVVEEVSSNSKGQDTSKGN